MGDEVQREYRSGVSDAITKLKRDLARDIEACAFPRAAVAPLKAQWQRALDAIDPLSGDGESRLTVLLARVTVYREDCTMPRINPFAPAGELGYAERERLTEALRGIEERLKSLITFAGWWRDA